MPVYVINRIKVLPVGHPYGSWVNGIIDKLVIEVFVLSHRTTTVHLLTARLRFTNSLLPAKIGNLSRRWKVLVQHQSVLILHSRFSRLSLLETGNFRTEFVFWVRNKLFVSAAEIIFPVTLRFLLRVETIRYLKSIFNGSLEGEVSVNGFRVRYILEEDASVSSASFYSVYCIISKLPCLAKQIGLNKIFF